MKRSFRRWFFTWFSGVLLAAIIFLWWSSSRWSERHIRYLGSRSIEVFSASSLIRFSFANGHIGTPGVKHQGYRQRNVRGKFILRPLKPSFRSNRGLWELTFGYWHLAILGIACSGAAFWVDRRRGKEGAESNPEVNDEEHLSD